MFSKPVIIGAVGGLILVFALALNFFVSNEDDPLVQVAGNGKVATVSAPPKPAPKKRRVKADPAPSASTESASKPAATAKPPAKVAAPATETASAPAKEATPVKPSFDVVRVDPDGNTVIAGRAAPNSNVTISDGDQEIGQVQADSRGEWVFLPKERLAIGNRVLSLKAQPKSGPAQESEEAVVVVIPEPGKDLAGNPTDTPSVSLAMVIPKSEVGAPSLVLQAPVAPKAQKTAAASASTSQQPAAPAAPKAPGAAVVAKVATPTVVDKPSGSSAIAAIKKVAKTASESAVAAVAGVTAATQSATTGAAAVAGSTAAPEIKTAAKAEPATKTVPAPAVETSTETVVASAAPATAPIATVVKSFPEPAKPAEQDAATDGKTAAKPSVSLDVVDYNDKGAVVFSGTTEPGKDVQVYVDNKLAGRDKADKAGKWAVTPETKVATGTHMVRIDKLEPTGAVAARIELPFMRAEPLRDLPAGQVVVIQPGNNLWRIAARVYGSGVRFHEIYTANLDQIRNPDLIYPGQVFGLPTLN